MQTRLNGVRCVYPHSVNLLNINQFKLCEMQDENVPRQTSFSLGIVNFEDL